MQLDATLRSLAHHCEDLNSSKIFVLYKAQGLRHKAQYQHLIAEYPNIHFIKEKEFRNDLLSIVHGSEYVTFLVDDCLFVDSFSFEKCFHILESDPTILGFSLRLGKNTTYCYMLDKDQNIPEYTSIKDRIIMFNWTTSEYDFGYPLEVSSSIYRTDTIAELLQHNFNNPNSLEGMFDDNKSTFKNLTPNLACFERSKAFCAPMNKVQKIARKNRASDSSEYSPKQLAKYFHQGYRINIMEYQSYLPKGCHEEVDLKKIKTKSMSTMQSLKLILKSL